MEHLNRMAVFQAVADAGSFRAAAKTLGISPSVVSHHISQLEAQFDLPLIYRSTRRLSLTDAGAELLQSTGRMTRAAEDGIAAMRRRKNNVSGRLKIAAPAIAQHPAFGSGFVEFAKQYPGVTLDVEFNDDFVNMGGSSFDLAFRGTAVHIDDSAYKSRKVASYDIWVVAAPSYIQGRPLPRTFSDLADWDRVRHPPGISLSDVAATPISIPEPRASIIVNGIYAAISYACEGMGFLMLPRLAVKDEVESGKLVRICTEAEFKPINIYAVWPQNISRDSIVHLAVDFVETFNSRMAKPDED